MPELRYNTPMTNTNKSVWVLIGAIILGFALMMLYRSHTAGPVSGEATTTSQSTATTTQANPADVQKILSSLDLKGMIDRARTLKAAGNYDGAIAVLNQAASVYPNDIIAYNNLGDLYMNFKKDYVKAELNYKKVIANDATQINAYRSLLQLYTIADYHYAPTPTAAADIVAAGIRAVPKAYDLQLVLARYYRDAGKTAQARVQYQAAIDNAKAQGLTAAATDMQAELQALPQ